MTFLARHPILRLLASPQHLRRTLSLGLKTIWLHKLRSFLTAGGGNTEASDRAVVRGNITAVTIAQATPNFGGAITVTGVAADITALLANRVVLEALSAIARRRYDEANGTRWDPAQPLLDGRVAPIPEGPMRGHQH